MTPASRRDDFLTRHQVIEEIDQRIKPIAEEQRVQARALEEIRARQASNHQEGLNKLNDVLQQGENQLFLLRERERLQKEFEEQRKKQLEDFETERVKRQKAFEDARQKRIDRWAKRVGLLITPAMFYQVINFIHRLWLWHITGHFFSESSR